ncbi:MAG: glycosyltransferase family 2 protein [Alphaproteobacteria bacterium]|nr:glycosyltransferase family 2 protein [Alphaproteobacteria bacterium]
MSQFSLVIPIYNEQESSPILAAEIYAKFAAWSGCPCAEVIFVDDGSRDESAARLRQFAKNLSPNAPTQPKLRVLRHSKNAGQSAALVTGIRAATAEWIVTLDGDGQNDPADIEKLWQVLQIETAQLSQPVKSGDSGRITPPRFVMMIGHRRHRRDSLSKKISSRLANAIRRGLLHDDTPDTGCSLKIFPRAAFLAAPVFNHMHRYLAALLIAQGGKIISVAVTHRPRQAGQSKYGFWDRLAVGVFDLLGVMWLLRRHPNPGPINEDS